MTWKFWVTHKEPEFLTDIRDFTNLFYMILRSKSSGWLELSVESHLLSMWFAKWSPDLAICDFTFFKHFSCVRTGHKKVSYLLIFMIWENKTFKSMILYFSRSWTVPETSEMLVSTDLFTAKYDWHHALRFSCLSWLINKYSAEPELRQARVTSTHTSGADHICMLKETSIS